MTLPNGSSYISLANAFLLGGLLIFFIMARNEIISRVIEKVNKHEVLTEDEELIYLIDIKGYSEVTAINIRKYHFQQIINNKFLYDYISLRKLKE